MANEIDHVTEPVAGDPQMVVAKWGRSASGGFQQIPDLLFKYQKRLRLTATDMVVLLNISMHWWHPDDRPFVQAHTIAKRMGISPRTVQRAIAKMESLGYLERVPTQMSIAVGKGFDLNGLVQWLEKFAENDPIVAKRLGASPQPDAA